MHINFLLKNKNLPILHYKVCSILKESTTFDVYLYVFGDLLYYRVSVGSSEILFPLKKQHATENLPHSLAYRSTHLCTAELLPYCYDEPTPVSPSSRCPFHSV